MASKLALLIDEQDSIKSLTSSPKKYPGGRKEIELNTLRNRQIALIKKLEKFGSRHEVVIVTFRIKGDTYKTQLHFTDISEQDAKLYVEGIFKRAEKEIKDCKAETIKTGFDWDLIN